MTESSSNAEKLNGHALTFSIIARTIVPAAATFLLVLFAFWFFALPTMRKNLVDARKAMIKEETNTAWNILDELRQDAEEEGWTVEEAQERAKEFIGELRYGPDNKDYFWINDITPRIIVHPYVPELNGRDVSEYEDLNGVRMFARMADLCKREGGGFVSYHWQWLDDPGRTEPKTSYVRLFEPWNWIVGTGMYMNDVNARIDGIIRTSGLIFATIGGLVLVLSTVVCINSIRAEKARLEATRELHAEQEELRAYRDHLEELVEERTREITRSSAELETANAELSAFSYSVSHDLRAPLRKMNGFSRALLDGYADSIDERGRHFLERICVNARNMGQLIDNLLRLSGISRVEMKCTTVDLSEIAEKTVAELKASEPSRNVRVAIEPNLTVNGDAKLFQTVLENLLGNAWKFTEKTEYPRVEFAATTNGACGDANAELSDGARVYFVRDNGAGFDMAYADKLFSPFERLHRQDEFEGSGIGLATVERIVRRHGGIAWARGAVGKGASFYFSLSPTRNKEEL